MHPKLIYSGPFFIAALLILLTAMFVLRWRRTRGAWYLILACLAGAVWAVFEGMLYLGLSLEADMLATYTQYLGAIPLVPLALFFTMSVFGFERWINRATVTVCVAAAATIIVLVWTDPLHHLVYKDHYLVASGPIPLRGIERGMVWWGLISYQYLLAAVICALLVYVVVTARGPRRAQAGVILASAGTVWGLNAIYVAGSSPVRDMDISPLGFIFVALAMAWGMMRHNLLDVLPDAKTEIFLGMKEPIIVLDDKNRILDLNPAAESLFTMTATRALGQNFELLLGGQPQTLPPGREAGSNEIRLQIQGLGRDFKTSTSELKDKRGTRIGWIIIFQEHTERKRVELVLREKERLQGVLELAGAVCHDLSQPVMAILGYAELLLIDLPRTSSLYATTLELTEQAQQLSDVTQKLMRITRYETKQWQNGRIIDIERASTGGQGN